MKRRLLTLGLAGIAFWGTSCFLLNPTPIENSGRFGTRTDVNNSLGDGDGPVADEFIPAMRSVIDGLRTGEDEIVRSLLLRMRARGPSGATLGWIKDVERILVGRDMVSHLGLSLEVRLLPIDGGGQTRMLGLRANTFPDSVESISLFISPPTLKIDRTWIDATGQDGQESDSVGIDTMTIFELSVEESDWIPIIPLGVPRGQAAAVREIWSLEMHHCYFMLGGEQIPVNAPLVAPCERYLLGSHLQLGWLEPNAVAEFASSTETFNMSQLVERAVRTRPSDWPVALDCVEGVLDSISQDRIQQLAPVLRWMATPEVSRDEWGIAHALGAMEGNDILVDGALVHPSALRQNPNAWRRWLKARASLRSQSVPSNLDLPEGN
jgi:hypothetical protein